MPLKRFAAAAMLTLCLIIFPSSCSRAPGAAADIDVSKSLQTPFEADARITLNGTEAFAKIARLEGMDCIVTFTAPDTLAGVVMELRSDELTVSLDGMSFNLLPKQLPAAITPRAVTCVLGSADTRAKRVDSNQAELSGISELGGYIIRIDRGSGAILSISAPESGFEAKLSDFSFSR